MAVFSAGGCINSGGRSLQVVIRAVATARKRGFFAPDLAFSLALVTLVHCFFVFGAPQQFFRDSDTGWHIRTGESIFASGALPRTDPYSFSRPGAPWFAWEWASDALMGCVHRTLGLGGVVSLFALAVAASTWCWIRLSWAAGGDFLLACALLPLMISTATLHWLARPHVLSWLFLFAALIAAEKAPPRLRGWHLAAGALFGALWANMHASFFLGPVIGLLFAIGRWLNSWIWGENTRRRSIGWLAAMSVATAAGSFANPYGWSLHGHIIRYLSDRELLARVAEFQSFNFHVDGAGRIVAMYLVCALAATLMIAGRRLDHLLFTLLLLAASLRSARNLPLLALLGLPLANAAIAGALGRATGLNPRLDELRRRFLDYSAGLRRLDAQLHGLAWAPLLMVVVFAVGASPHVSANAGFPPDQFPVAAAAAVDSLPHGARILAPDKFGGYLIYRFKGQRKVFMDGRSDFYGVEFMKNYIRLVEVRPGWRTEIERFGFTHALLPVNYSLVDALEHERWKRVYVDRTAVLLQRPLP